MFIDLLKALLNKVKPTEHQGPPAPKKPVLLPAGNGSFYLPIEHEAANEPLTDLSPVTVTMDMGCMGNFDRLIAELSKDRRDTDLSYSDKKFILEAIRTYRRLYECRTLGHHVVILKEEDDTLHEFYSGAHNDPFFEQSDV